MLDKCEILGTNGEKEFDIDVDTLYLEEILFWGLLLLILGILSSYIFVEGFLIVLG